jgi:hypothetical protein
MNYHQTNVYQPVRPCEAGYHMAGDKPKGILAGYSSLKVHSAGWVAGPAPVRDKCESKANCDFQISLDFICV